MLLFVGLFCNLLCYSSLVVSEEIISSRRRSLFSSVINTGYGLCGIMYSIIFMYVQNWRYDFYILIGLSLFTDLIIFSLELFSNLINLIRDECHNDKVKIMSLIILGKVIRYNHEEIDKKNGKSNYICFINSRI